MRPLENSGVRRCTRARLLVLACVVAIVGVAAPAGALRTAHGPVFPVGAFVVEYALDQPRHIDPEDLLELEVGLTSLGLAYVAPRPVDRTVRMRLSSIPDGASFSATAIQHITQFVVSTFNRRGFNGIIVTVPDIDEETGTDLRPRGETTLRLRIWTGRITRLTSVADGERFEDLGVEQRTNHTAHGWIRDRAPVQPGGLRGLLDVEALEDYAAEISRHPGRRVDVELDPGDLPGTTDVNLRIAENKPWVVYAQYSNTGTTSTTRNRERFGFLHNQATGRDDIFRIDYTTGDFSDVHAVVASYTGPFSLRLPELRFRVAGLYSEFDSSEVGFVDSDFHGEQALGEAQIVYNFFQRHELFVDAYAGARFHVMSVENDQFGSSGGLEDEENASFLVPKIGVAGERRTRTSRLLFDANLALGITGEDEEDLEILGTPEPDDRFTLLRWNGSYAFYLEPLIDRQAWEDPSTPSSSTLAHEVALSFRGQWAFDNRLVPQYQEIAGGLYTVRGYKQATIARDNLLLGSAEYRLHIPRLFEPDPAPAQVPLLGDFRLHPESVFGRPDWDLVVRFFSDAARALASDRRSLDDESHETLLSIGAGLELQILRNLNLRADAGRVLSSAGSAEPGDIRGHLMATLLY
jgi:hemolysin activation/secretion protein